MRNGGGGARIIKRRKYEWVTGGLVTGDSGKVMLNLPVISVDGIRAKWLMRNK